MSLPTYKFTLRDAIRENKVNEEEVTEIRLWMPTANFPKVSDEVIVSFIIACKRDLEKTRSAIKAYFEIKASAPDLFDDRDIDKDDALMYTFKIVNFAVLPVRTSDDCSVFFFNLIDTKYYNFNFEKVTKLLFMLVDVCLNTTSPPSGIKIIIDAKGAGFLHLTRFKIRTLRKFIGFLQEGMPLNTVAVHVINSIPMVDKLLFIIKPFLDPELYSLLTLHSGTTDLEEFTKQYIPKKCLPKDYGGELSTMADYQQQAIEKFRELKGFYEREQKIRNQWSRTHYE